MSPRRVPRYAVGDKVEYKGFVYLVKEVLWRKAKDRHLYPAYLLVRRYGPTKRQQTYAMTSGPNLRKVK